MRLLIVAAGLCLLGLLIWLAQPERVGDPLPYLLLTGAVLLRAIGWGIEWMNYWSITVPPVMRPRRQWTADVLTTACPGEPFGMIERTLRAMVAIRYPHRNFLCDEGNDPKLKALCDELGVTHVTRVMKKHAKAGNINNALQQATGQVVVVLDPDHEPAPYLLDRTVGYFEDPTVGFVQGGQPYRNQGDSLVARGAAEQTYHFYGPIMMGMHGRGTTQAIGANCVFRRAALDSIGGHASGLAEDMHTSMRLYSRGWRSVYVPEVLTRGLVPSTLGAFFKQQIKWSCGAFDLLFQEYGKLFRGFTLWQKIQYGFGPSFFLRGFITAMEIVAPILCLVFGMIAWRATLLDLLAWGLPVLVIGTVIRMRAQRWLIEPHERGFHFAGGFLATGTWWVYSVGVVCAIFRVKVPYIPTPKEDEPRDAWRVTLPNWIAAGVSVAAIVYGLHRDSSPQTMLMASLAGMNALILVTISLAGQQKTMLEIRRRLTWLRNARRLVRPAMAAVDNSYAWALAGLRERLVVPALIVLLAVSGAQILKMVNGSHPIEQIHDTTLAKESGRFYAGIGVAGVAELSEVARFERSLNARFGLVSVDMDLTESSLAAAAGPLMRLCEGGAIPLLRIKMNDAADGAFALKRIARGDATEHLAGLAAQLRELSHPVLVSFNPVGTSEADLADFGLAWSRIGKLFNAEGATNVGWVWCAPETAVWSAACPQAGVLDWIAVECDPSAPPDDHYGQVRSAAKEAKLPLMVIAAGKAAPTPEWNAALLKAAEARDVQAVVLPLRTTEQAAQTRDVQAWLARSAPSGPQTVAVLAATQPHRPAPVAQFVQGQAGQFQLMVDGAPFYVRGVAYNAGHDWRDGNLPLSRRQLDRDFARIRAMGANVIRRYGRGWYDRNILNVAAEHDLKVIYGFWFDQDVDYLTDTAKIDAYRAQVLATVRQYKDHPSVLGWTLGNEVWGLLKHKFSKPYLVEVRLAHVRFVEDLARQIKEIDPHHPVFAVHEHSRELAGALADYARLAPSLDAIGVNSYFEEDIGHLNAIAERFDPKRPYLVSEFGPDGYWDTVVAKSSLGGLVEATATEKAALYARRWTQHIQGHNGHNIGGVAYCWQDRFEGTATWFGMNDLNGNPKPAFHAMQAAWNADHPATAPAPQIAGPVIERIRGPKEAVTDRQPFIVRADVTRSEGVELQYTWSVVGPKFATDVGRIKPLLSGEAAEVLLPDVPGWYRVQVRASGPAGFDEASYPVEVTRRETGWRSHVIALGWMADRK